MRSLTTFAVCVCASRCPRSGGWRGQRASILVAVGQIWPSMCSATTTRKAPGLIFSHLGARVEAASPAGHRPAVRPSAKANATMASYLLRSRPVAPFRGHQRLVITHSDFDLAEFAVLRFIGRDVSQHVVFASVGKGSL